MKDRHSRFFEMDDTLRLIFAFYSCMSLNPNWILESEHSKHNREIAEELLGIENMADYYFLLQGRFYGFTVEKESDESVFCKMVEYDTFYDLSEQHLSMNFSYHVPSKMIVHMDSIERVQDKTERQKKKVA